ncbi:MAG: aminoglycoside phosphotransferase family protein [Phycisphaerae bacterium]|nr:aminoglycoside phosphotransferase family protein [Phycisphaerae bacterium]
MLEDLRKADGPGAAPAAAPASSAAERSANGSRGPVKVPAAGPSPPSGDASGLAAALAPVLRSMCDGRLSEIQWFKSPWQKGGAATGLATWTDAAGTTSDVVVKLPVGPNEFRWTVGLGSDASVPRGSASGPTPRVEASGMEIGGYDLCWLVMERLPGQPLSVKFDARAATDLVDATARWYARTAATAPPGDAPATPDWDALLTKARDAAKSSGMEQSQRWNKDIKQVQHLLPHLMERWNARPINTWCHGDLHPGNALRRSDGTCVLIDLALVHAGHWVEDALYLERLHWGRPEQLGGLNVVAALAAARKRQGLNGHEDYVTLANVRRLLMAACVPAFLTKEGHPRYVGAALETLTRLLPQARHWH